MKANDTPEFVSAPTKLVAVGSILHTFLENITETYRRVPLIVPLLEDPLPKQFRKEPKPKPKTKPKIPTNKPKDYIQDNKNVKRYQPKSTLQNASVPGLVKKSQGKKVLPPGKTPNAKKEISNQVQRARLVSNIPKNSMIPSPIVSGPKNKGNIPRPTLNLNNQIEKPFLTPYKKPQENYQEKFRKKQLKAGKAPIKPVPESLNEQLKICGNNFALRPCPRYEGSLIPVWTGTGRIAQKNCPAVFHPTAKTFTTIVKELRDVPNDSSSTSLINGNQPLGITVRKSFEDKSAISQGKSAIPQPIRIARVACNNNTTPQTPVPSQISLIPRISQIGQKMSAISIKSASKSKTTVKEIRNLPNANTNSSTSMNGYEPLILPQRKSIDNLIVVQKRRCAIPKPMQRVGKVGIARNNNIGDSLSMAIPGKQPSRSNVLESSNIQVSSSDMLGNVYKIASNMKMQENSDGTVSNEIVLEMISRVVSNVNMMEKIDKSVSRVNIQEIIDRAISNTTMQMQDIIERIISNANVQDSINSKKVSSANVMEKIEGTVSKAIMLENGQMTVSNTKVPEKKNIDETVSKAIVPKTIGRAISHSNLLGKIDQAVSSATVQEIIDRAISNATMQMHDYSIVDRIISNANVQDSINSKAVSSANNALENIEGTASSKAIVLENGQMTASNMKVLENINVGETISEAIAPNIIGRVISYSYLLGKIDRGVSSVNMHEIIDKTISTAIMQASIEKSISNVNGEESTFKALEMTDDKHSNLNVLESADKKNSKLSVLEILESSLSNLKKLESSESMVSNLNALENVVEKVSTVKVPEALGSILSNSNIRDNREEALSNVGVLDSYYSETISNGSALENIDISSSKKLENTERSVVKEEDSNIRREFEQTSHIDVTTIFSNSVPGNTFPNVQDCTKKRILPAGCKGGPSKRIQGHKLKPIKISRSRVYRNVSRKTADIGHQVESLRIGLAAREGFIRQLDKKMKKGFTILQDRYINLHENWSEEGSMDSSAEDPWTLLKSYGKFVYWIKDFCEKSIQEINVFENKNIFNGEKMRGSKFYHKSSIIIEGREVPGIFVPIPPITKELELKHNRTEGREEVIIVTHSPRNNGDNPKLNEAIRLDTLALAAQLSPQMSILSTIDEERESLVTSLETLQT